MLAYKEKLFQNNDYMVYELMVSVDYIKTTLNQYNNGVQYTNKEIEEVLTDYNFTNLIIEEAKRLVDNKR